MNIDDVKNEEVQLLDGEDVIQKLFIKQFGLAVRYGPIEERNGFYHPSFVGSVENNIDDQPEFMLIRSPHIDDAKYQSWIKNFFWRATEELAEALETPPDMSQDNYLQTRWESDSDLRHFYEEIADATHFIVEVSLVSGVNPNLIQTMFEHEVILQAADHDKAVSPTWVRNAILDVILAMGLAANCLKNKPWKSTQMETDKAKFDRNMTVVWSKLITLLVGLNLNAKALYSLYAKKSAVNFFRQNSNY